MILEICRKGKQIAPHLKSGTACSGTLEYRLKPCCEWALVTPRDGTSTGEHDTITVSVDTTGLSSGQHSCDVHIDSNGGSGVFTVSVNIIYIGDVLDQYQEQYNGDFQVHGDQWGAQSFTPTLDTLTRAELYLYQQGTPDNIVVSIRESLSGSDLASVVKTPAEIPGSIG